jgi:hypothetical protein
MIPAPSRRSILLFNLPIKFGSRLVLYLYTNIDDKHKTPVAQRLNTATGKVGDEPAGVKVSAISLSNIINGHVTIPVAVNPSRKNCPDPRGDRDINANPPVISNELKLPTIAVIPKQIQNVTCG